MPVYGLIILALWLALVAFWVVLAPGAKRSINGTRAWRRAIVWRVVVVVLVLIALRSPTVTDALQNASAYAVNTNMLAGVVGVVLCAVGVGLAVFARVYLGRNWGIPMSRKEEPELVTAGPYAFLRHPIYAGLLLGMLGSAIGQSIFWLLPLIFFGARFIYSAQREEQIMIDQFPEQYRAYMRRTKMLLPFVL